MSWDHMGEFLDEMLYWNQLQEKLHDSGHRKTEPSYRKPHLDGDTLIIPNGPGTEPTYDWAKSYRIRRDNEYYVILESGHSDERGYREWTDAPDGYFSAFELAGKYFIYSWVAEYTRMHVTDITGDPIGLPIINHEWIRRAATLGVAPGWISTTVHPKSEDLTSDKKYTEASTGRNFCGLGDEPSVTWLLSHSYEELRSIYSDGLLDLVS